MKNLVLMTTAGCHLCEVAEGIIVSTLVEGCVVEAQDIAHSDALIEQYGTSIPVVVCERSGQALGWPFDAQQLAAFVAQLPES